MDQNKIGEVIKQIRKEHNLTQKEFAEKYGVTYQAVSKWENGKNLPDMYLLKKISQDFNIDMEELLDGNKQNKREINYAYLKSALIGVGFIVLMFIFVLLGHNDSYEFKTLSSKCNDFNISGTISYNDKKSSIFINKIIYCGGNDEQIYKDIECTLYENDGDIDKRIATVSHDLITPTKLEDFLENANFIVDNYTHVCKDFKNGNLFLKINATDLNNNVITYEVPLELGTDFVCK